MDFSVSINEQTRERFFKPIFDKYPNLENQIISDFRKYKESNGDIVPNYFGRDTAYVEPLLAYKIGLMHIHLCFPPNKFNDSVAQYYRVCKKGQTDVCLVYVSGSFNINYFSLLAIFSPDAHEKSRNKSIMDYICRVAEDFYNNN
ncbi:type II toxin-antitoxin system YafO family toxin [Orbaceae bacterium ac157xtp]